MVEEIRSNIFPELKKSDLQRETKEILREPKLGFGLPFMRSRNRPTKIVRVTEKKKRERESNVFAKWKWIERGLCNSHQMRDK